MDNDVPVFFELKDGGHCYFRVSKVYNSGITIHRMPLMLSQEDFYAFAQWWNLTEAPTLAEEGE